MIAVDLEVSGLRAGYASGDILKGVELKVPQGKVVTIIGPNGSGKSTLLKTVVGLLTPRMGKIVLMGQDLGKKSAPQRVREGLGYVPQEFNVFRNLSVLENLKLAHEFMAPVRIKPVNDLPEELDSLFPELRGKMQALAGNLSGGQRQMLAFACAMLGKPKLLVLDEPSAGLSPKYTTQILECVRRVNRTGTTILMVEQNVIEALVVSDVCVVMANGRVRAATDARNIDTADLSSLYLGHGELNVASSV